MSLELNNYVEVTIEQKQKIDLFIQWLFSGTYFWYQEIRNHKVKWITLCDVKYFFPYPRSSQTLAEVYSSPLFNFPTFDVWNHIGQHFILSWIYHHKGRTLYYLLDGCLLDSVNSLTSTQVFFIPSTGKKIKNHVNVSGRKNSIIHQSQKVLLKSGLDHESWWSRSGVSKI